MRTAGARRRTWRPLCFRQRHDRLDGARTFSADRPAASRAARPATIRETSSGSSINSACRVALLQMASTARVAHGVGFWLRSIEAHPNTALSGVSARARRWRKSSLDRLAASASARARCAASYIRARSIACAA
jgi:hypothetical protein